MTGTLAATSTQGQPVYLGTSDRLLYIADGNVSAATALVVGILVTGGSVNQPATYIVWGDIDLGATLTLAEIYCLSDVAGAIRPEGDNATGDFVTVLGVATATNNLRIGILASGVQVP